MSLAGLIIRYNSIAEDWAFLLTTWLSHINVYYGTSEKSDAQSISHQLLWTLHPNLHHDSFTSFQKFKSNLNTYCSNFDVQHHLNGNVTLKTWGLADKPQIGWIAGCISLHPADMIEYVTPGKEWSIVTFVQDDSVFCSSSRIARYVLHVKSMSCAHKSNSYLRPLFLIIKHRQPGGLDIMFDT